MTLDVEFIVYTFYLLGGTRSVYEQCSQDYLLPRRAATSSASFVLSEL